MKLSKEKFLLKTIGEAKKIGVEIDNNKADKIYQYKEMLLKWNEIINLTAITDDEEIIQKHIIDSLETVKYIKEGQKIIDVGTGAGLPGIIIAIYFDGKIDITLFDALNKRIVFLQEVIKKLELKNVTAVHGRAEETSRQKDYREKYDIVISRAVAVLNILMELTAPLARINGLCLYMKADKTEEELKISSHAAKELGLKYETTIKYNITVNDEKHNHTIIKFIKEKDTKVIYPRQFSKIKKMPL